MKKGMSSFIKKIIALSKAFLQDPLCLKKWDSPDYYRHLSSADQLSIKISSSKKSDLYSYNGDSFGFTQDMHSGIMPFMHYRGKREAYPTRVEPASAEKERLIVEGISSRDNAHFLEDALCDFVRRTAQMLYHDGVAFYEIIADRNEEGDIESFEFESIRYSYFFHLFSSYYQIIPWGEAKKAHTRVQIVKIPEEKILRIDFPKKLGGGRKLMKVVKRLWKLSEEIIPKFQMEAMEKDRSIGFDMEKFSEAKYLEIAKLTRDFGWGQRQRSENRLSKYYIISRHLKAKKAEAIIRGEIISGLNSALNGLVLNLGTRVSMSNLFIVEDVEKQEEILTKGNVTFVDVINAIKID